MVQLDARLTCWTGAAATVAVVARRAPKARRDLKMGAILDVDVDVVVVVVIVVDVCGVVVIVVKEELLFVFWLRERKE